MKIWLKKLIKDYENFEHTHKGYIFSVIGHIAFTENAIGTR